MSVPGRVQVGVESTASRRGVFRTATGSASLRVCPAMVNARQAGPADAATYAMREERVSQCVRQLILLNQKAKTKKFAKDFVLKTWRTGLIHWDTPPLYLVVPPHQNLHVYFKVAWFSLLSRSNTHFSFVVCLFFGLAYYPTSPKIPIFFKALHISLKNCRLQCIQLYFTQNKNAVQCGAFSFSYYFYEVHNLDANLSRLERGHTMD